MLIINIAVSDGNSPASQPSSSGVVPSPAEWAGHRDYLEVYVSAVEHPSHFWVQVISSKATRLDDLFQEMTRYYSNLREGQVILQAIVVDEYKCNLHFLSPVGTGL